MLDILKNLFFEQVWHPLLHDNPKYTLGETLLYAFLFIGFVWLAYNFFERMKIKIDFLFYTGWSGWVLLMAGSRVLEDQGFFVSRLFITPYIDILFASVVFCLLYLLKKGADKEFVNFNLVWVLLPYILFIFALFGLSFSNMYGGFLILLILSDRKSVV